MKKYIISTLIIACVLLSGYFVFQKIRSNQVAQCLPDSRMARTAWATYVSKEFKFSVDYPVVLDPQAPGPFEVAMFRAKTEPYSNTPLGVDISRNDVRPENINMIPGIKSYQCVQTMIGGGPNTSARTINVFLADAYINHRSSTYGFSISGMSRQDAERMVNSIKFIE